jgi:hypothetical protein
MAAEERPALTRPRAPAWASCGRGGESLRRGRTREMARRRKKEKKVLASCGAIRERKDGSAGAEQRIARKIGSGTDSTCDWREAGSRSPQSGSASVVCSSFAPDSQALPCPSGRRSTYPNVRNCGATSIFKASDAASFQFDERSLLFSLENHGTLVVRRVHFSVSQPDGPDISANLRRMLIVPLRGQ